MLGGTSEAHESAMDVDAQVTEDIMHRCLRLEPELADARILKAIVGLRPGRSAVRLAAEPLDAKHLIVHNYGHGGSGFTLAWGCAVEVVEHVDRFVREGATL